MKKKKTCISPVSVCLWRRASVAGSSCSMWHLGSSGQHNQCVFWSPSLTNHTQQQTLTTRNTILGNKWMVPESVPALVIKLRPNICYRKFINFNTLYKHITIWWPNGSKEINNLYLIKCRKVLFQQPCTCEIVYNCLTNN